MGSWNYSVFWNEAMNQAKAELGEHEFAMWFNIEYDSSTESAILVRVPSSFYRDQLVRQYQKYLETKLFELTGKTLGLEFLVVKPQPAEPAILSSAADAGQGEGPIHRTTVPGPTTRENLRREFHRHPQLRLDYTFENFVIGDNNGFAANAALAISKNPGTSYNPFLIYGGVGLGKTHLMQSIGNRVWLENGKAKVICITAEEFTNEFIQSIHDKTTQNFKNKYRYVDVLLIDDIHFLQNKLGSQEELFHTFNALYDANKQMVFTCDRPVSELKNLSDRLRSRFERGLNVDLQPPNFETRCAILKKKV